MRNAETFSRRRSDVPSAYRALSTMKKEFFE